MYALVKEWNDVCETVDVSYPTFYPYNYGKDVCIGLDPNGNCNGPIDGNKQMRATLIFFRTLSCLECNSALIYVI